MRVAKTGGKGLLTRAAVEVSDAEDIGGTALGDAVEADRAERSRGFSGNSEGGGGEAEDRDQRVLHFERWLVVLETKSSDE